MRVVTAVGDPKINEELKKDVFYDVVGVDIQYQDGVFEVLENNKNIDYLILNINLFGDLNEFDFLEKIIEENKFLNLIIILEKENNKLINFLLSNNIKNILLKINNNLNEINNIIKNKMEFKFFEEKNKSNKNKIKTKIKINYNKLNKNKKLILYFGNKKINKNYLLILFFKLINKKILFVELINIFNYENEKEELIKLNKKINLLKCEINTLNRNDLKNMFNEYDYIFFSLFNIKDKLLINKIINNIFN